MKLLDFSKYYPTEESCKAKLRLEREKEGIICKNCDNNSHYWCASIEKWQCKICRSRLSLQSGTVMENSKLPLLYWFKAMHLMTATKKGISALELQTQLGHNRYEPIWAMLHKIRAAMGQREAIYQLEGEFEMDEGFFEQVILDKNERAIVNKVGVKRGRGSEKQSKVLVMIGSQEVVNHNPKKYDKNKKCGYLKMKVLDDLKAITIKEEVVKSVKSTAKAITDDFKGYVKLKEVLSEHQAHNTQVENVNKVLPWVHTAISNAKRNLLGIYHMISDKHMQNYLNEFCYRFNRRYMKEILFDRLVIAAISFTPEPEIENC